MSNKLIVGIGPNARPFRISDTIDWYDFVYYCKTGEYRSFDLVTGDSPNKSKRKFDNDGYIITGVEKINKCNICDVKIPKRARLCGKCREKKRRESWRKAKTTGKR